MKKKRSSKAGATAFRPEALSSFNDARSTRSGTPVARGCAQIVEPIEDADAIGAVINDAAAAYRGVIPADRWHEPYMPREELLSEMRAGVKFFCFRRDGRVVGVMGLQQVADVALIRHAYTVSSQQHGGVGTLLLEHLKRQADRPLLVGTWKAATWAVRFYERRGFRLVSDEEKERLLRRYWNIPERQVAESVVLRK
jgi:N-acetylglutamate synthase-like GNAT family acetyltransferase